MEAEEADPLRPRAAAYARLSEDRESQAAGVSAQLDVCRRYASDAGLELVAELADNDISASRYGKAKRPAYAQLLELLRSGAASHVVVRETSRLYRRPRDLEDLIDLCEHQGVSVHAPLGGKIDLSSASGRFHARILVAADAMESDRIRERVAYRHDALAKSGAPSGGGWRPFGLRPRNPSGKLDQGYELEPGEAVVVREVADRVLRGETLWSVADDLATRGVKTTAAGRRRKDGKVMSGAWSVTSLRRMLSAPYLAGLRVHTRSAPGGKRETLGIYQATWPAILPLDVWEALQAVLAARHRPRAPRGRAYLLSGLVWCERCDRRMDGHLWQGVRRYQCHSMPGRPGCGVTVVAESLEAWVAAELFAQVDETERRKAKSRDRQPDLLALSDQRSRLEAKRAELAAAYADGRLSMELVAEADARLRADLAGVDQLLRLAPGGAEMLGGPALVPLAELWERATFAQRRRLLEQAVLRVRVRPARRAGRASKPADRASLDFRLPLG